MGFRSRYSYLRALQDLSTYRVEESFRLPDYNEIDEIIQDEVSKFLPEGVSVYTLGKIKHDDGKNDTSKHVLGVHKTVLTPEERASIVAVSITPSNRSQINKDEILRTARHESMHAMRRLGIISEDDWKILLEQAPEWREKFNVDALWGEHYKEKRSPDHLENILNEEAICEAFSFYLEELDKSPEEELKKSLGEGSFGIFEKSKKFLGSLTSRIREAFGLDIDKEEEKNKNWEEIFKSLYTGDFKDKIRDYGFVSKDYYNQKDSLEKILEDIDDPKWSIVNIIREDRLAYPALVHEDYATVIIQNHEYDIVEKGLFSVYDPGSQDILGPSFHNIKSAIGAAARASFNMEHQSFLLYGDSTAYEFSDLKHDVYTIIKEHSLNQEKEGVISVLQDDTGLPHSLDQPAMVFSSGREMWMQHGILHNEDGPADIDPEKGVFYYQNGVLHNDHGPAAIYNNGLAAWYKNGEPYEPSYKEIKDYTMFAPDAQRSYFEDHRVFNSYVFLNEPVSLDLKNGYTVEFSRKFKKDNPFISINILSESGEKIDLGLHSSFLEATSVVSKELEEIVNFDPANSRLILMNLLRSEGAKDDFYVNFDENGLFHKEDGPAYINPDEMTLYVRHGKKHREDGPALEEVDGRFNWFKDDQRYKPSHEEILSYAKKAPAPQKRLIESSSISGSYVDLAKKPVGFIIDKNIYQLNLNLSSGMPEITFSKFDKDGNKETISTSSNLDVCLKKGLSRLNISEKDKEAIVTTLLKERGFESSQSLSSNSIGVIRSENKILQDSKTAKDTFDKSLQLKSLLGKSENNSVVLIDGRFKPENIYDIISAIPVAKERKIDSVNKTRDISDDGREIA